MPIRAPRLAGLRPEDRVERQPIGTQLGMTGLLAGTAIVAASVIGLLMYDARHPFGYGTAPAPALVISVEPAGATE